MLVPAVGAVCPSAAVESINNAEAANARAAPLTNPRFWTAACFNRPNSTHCGHAESRNSDPTKADNSIDTRLYASLKRPASFTTGSYPRKVRNVAIPAIRENCVKKATNAAKIADGSSRNRLFGADSHSQTETNDWRASLISTARARGKMGLDSPESGPATQFAGYVARGLNKNRSKSGAGGLLDRYR